MALKLVLSASNHAAGFRELDDPGRGKTMSYGEIRNHFALRNVRRNFIEAFPWRLNSKCYTSQCEID